MARLFKGFAATSAIAAALSLAATPAAAHDGYGRYGHRDHGVDAGDVLAGVLIIGGIAAIASAASKSKRDERYRDESYRTPPPDYSYRDPAPNYSYRGQAPGSYQSGSQRGGIDNAVNLCVDQVERGDTRVASVDNAARTADGWQISGQLRGGSQFNCVIDNDGRIRNVDLGYTPSSYSRDYPGSYQGSDNQYDDATYARARAQADTNLSYASGGVDGDLAGSAGY